VHKNHNPRRTKCGGGGLKQQPMTDEELLIRFANGDDVAFGELAGRYERPLRGLALGLLGGSDDLARDAVQETWMRVIRSAGSFQGRSTVRTWLYQIAINRCRTMRTKRGRDMKRMQCSAAESADRAETGGDAGHIDPVALRSAVARLDAAKREVVLLCYHADLTHEQVATILAIPLGTVKSRLNAALSQLRKTLTPEVCT